MFAVAAVISILLLALAGSDVFVSSYNSEELSNMGVQEKWETFLSPSLTQNERRVRLFYLNLLFPPYRSVGRLDMVYNSSIHASFEDIFQ